MKYIVFPKSVLDEISQEVLDELHLVPRISTDGDSVLMKVSNYNLLFPPVMMLPELGDETPIEPTYPYPTYEGESLSKLLESSEWTASSENVLDEPILEAPVAKTSNVASTKSRKSTKNTVL